MDHLEATAPQTIRRRRVLPLEAPASWGLGSCGESSPRHRGSAPLLESIPTRLDELTPDRLTAALREASLLGGGRVRAIDQEILGEGEGFLGAIARLRLDYEGLAYDAPGSLVAKLPTPVHENRTIGEMLGAYWREIHFYRELSASLPIRVPRFYYGALSDDPMRERQDKIVARLDRLPSWLVTALMWGAGWLVKRNDHRYVLLIEDLAPAAVGDQLAGADPSVCARVLELAAKLHGRFWQDPGLEHTFWLAKQNVGLRIRTGMYRHARKDFRRRCRELPESDWQPIIDWLDANCGALNAVVHGEAPQTLIHCDLRLDNVFFHPEGDIVLADWQLVGVGAAAYDVAYLVSGALRTDEAPEVEHELLRGYHAALESNGVEGYPFERFQRDYWRGLFAVLQILATTNSVDLGEGRGTDLIRCWLDRTLTLLRRAPLDEVL